MKIMKCFYSKYCLFIFVSLGLLLGTREAKATVLFKQEVLGGQTTGFIGYSIDHHECYGGSSCNDIYELFPIPAPRTVTTTYMKFFVPHGSQNLGQITINFNPVAEYYATCYYTSIQNAIDYPHERGSGSHCETSYYVSTSTDAIIVAAFDNFIIPTGATDWRFVTNQGLTLGTYDNGSGILWDCAADDPLDLPNCTAHETISIDFPADNSILTNDFMAWSVKATSTAPDGTIYGIGIRYATTSDLSGMGTYADYGAMTYYSNNPASSMIIKTSNNLWSLFAPNTTTTTFFAIGYLYDYNTGTVLALSNEISFILKVTPTSNIPLITGGGVPSVLPLTSTTIGIASSIAALFSVDCSQYNGIGIFDASSGAAFTCYLEAAGLNLLKFFVVPHTLSLDTFAGAIRGLTSLFPFNIFLSFSNVINGTFTGTGTISIRANANSTIYDRLTFNQNTAIFGNTPITLITSSSLASFIGEDAKNYLFTIEKSVMYIVFLMLVIITLYEKVKSH